MFAARALPCALKVKGCRLRLRATNQLRRPGVELFSWRWSVTNQQRELGFEALPHNIPRPSPRIGTRG
jgi:hypothetical protein